MYDIFGTDNEAEKSDESEAESSGDHLDSPTLELPGLDDSEDKPDKSSKDPAPESLKADGAQDMRGAYWDFIHKEQIKVKKEHPELSGKEVLKMCRDRKLGCNIEIINNP